MQWRKSVGSLGTVLWLWGCSSAAPPPPEVPADDTPVQASPADEDPSPPEPVAAPEGLFGVGRIKSPAQLSDLVSDWVNVPVPLEAVLQKELPALREVVRLDAPVDFTLSLDPDSFNEPKLLFAASVGLSDYRTTLEALRSHGHPVERIAPGMQLVSLGTPCLVARANGPAPARLICGDSRKDLDVLAPYMAASLPSENLGQDELFVELRAAPVRDRFGKKAGWLKVGIPVFLREVATGNPRFDAAIAETTRAVVDELLAVIPDLDRMVVRAKATAGREALDVHLGLVMGGSKSWLSQTLALRAQDAAAAPDIFWKLPAEARQASYWTANSHPERLKPVLEGLSEVLVGAAEHFEVSTKPLGKFVEALLRAHRGAGEFVIAEGPPAPGVTRHGGEPLLSLLGDGYTLAGSKDDEGQTATFYAALIDLLNDSVWRKEFAKKFEDDALAKVPPIKKSKAPARYGLPAGTQLYQWQVPGELLTRLLLSADGSPPKGSPPKADAQTPVTLAMFLVQTEGQTWIAASVDEGLAAEKLALTLSGSGPSLAANPSLTALREHQVVFGGFTTLSNFAGTLAPYATVSGQPLVTRDQFVLAMPHGGKTPIITTLRIDPAGPSTWYTFNVPRAAMEDLAAGMVAAAANMDAF